MLAALPYEAADGWLPKPRGGRGKLEHMVVVVVSMRASPLDRDGSRVCIDDRRRCGPSLERMCKYKIGNSDCDVGIFCTRIRGVACHTIQKLGAILQRRAC